MRNVLSFIKKISIAENEISVAKLLICKGFTPSSITDNKDCNYLFVGEDSNEVWSIIEVSKAYGSIYIERSIYERYKEELNVIHNKLTVIDDIVASNNQTRQPRIAFLASNDTHVQFMQKLSKYFDDYIYIIPNVAYKDEGAKKRLEELNEKYIEIHIKDKECKQLHEFEPDIIFSAADYTSDYKAVKRVMKRSKAKFVALQEGPQDWHIKTINKGKLIVLNHYRNADIIFSIGARTFHYIRPKYFSVTGNPKMPTMGNYSLPNKPKVLINCNFTYLQSKPSYEGKRQLWMESVLRVCKKIGIEYVISRHPRDDSEWPGEPIISSNAYKIKDQMMDCSVCVSRFSSLVYEAASYGRMSIYYNVGLEPMATFQDESDNYVPCVTTEAVLEELLLNHMNKYPPTYNYDKAKGYLMRHSIGCDGRAEKRIVSMLSNICNNTVDADRIPFPNAEYSWNSEEERKEQLGNAERNIIIALHDNERDKTFLKAISMAERMAQNGIHVILAVNKYPQIMENYKIYEKHQCIEVVLTQAYNLDLCGISVGELYYSRQLKKNNVAISNLRETLKGMKYKEKVIL